MSAALTAEGAPERFGRYLIMRHMREPSGMGTLAIAFDTSARRLVVLKRVRSPEKNRDHALRFQDEVGVHERLRRQQQLQHANIVQALAAGELQGEPYITFEWVLGKNLDDLSERSRRLEALPPGPVAALIVRQICRGLEYAHAVPGLGFVHRDLSPANIIVGFDGTAKLLDFGLALSAVKRSRTLPGIVSGTPGFLSPEQRRGEAVDARTDLYSLGSILYYLLSGRLPYNSHTDGTAATPRLASFDGLHVDRLLDETVARALNDREQRFQTAGEMGAALDRFLAEQPAELAHIARYLARIFPGDEEQSRADAAKLSSEGQAWVVDEPVGDGSAESPAHSEPPAPLGSAERRARAKTLIIARPGVRPRVSLWAWLAGAISALGVAAVAVWMALASGGPNQAPGSSDSPPPPRRPPAASLPGAVPSPTSPLLTPPTLPQATPSPSLPPQATPTPSLPTPATLPTSPPARAAKATAGPARTTPARLDRVAAAAALERADNQFGSAQYTKAVGSATQAIGLGAGAAAYQMRAEAELRLGRKADAARDFRMVLKLEPGNDDARAGLQELNE